MKIKIRNFRTIKADQVRLRKKFMGKRTWNILQIAALCHEERLVLLSYLGVSDIQKVYRQVGDESKKSILACIQEKKYSYEDLRCLVRWCNEDMHDSTLRDIKHTVLHKMMKRSNKKQLQELCVLSYSYYDSQRFEKIYDQILKKLEEIMTFKDWECVDTRESKTSFFVYEPYKEEIMRKTAKTFSDYCRFMGIFQYPHRGEAAYKNIAWFESKIDEIGIDTLSFEQIVQISHYGKYTYVFWDKILHIIDRDKPSVEKLKKMRTYYMKNADTFGIVPHSRYFFDHMADIVKSFDEAFDLFKYFQSIELDASIGYNRLFRKLRGMDLSKKQLEKLYKTKHDSLKNIVEEKMCVQE